MDLEDFGTAVNDWGKVEVTSKCHGAMTCRVLAADIFQEVCAASKPVFDGAFTEAGRDVKDRYEYQAVRRAISCCPAKAIRWVRTPQLGEEAGNIPALFAGFPQLIEDDVYHVGYTGMPTFGAASYFIKRGDGQNLLIDPPEVIASLVEALTAMGGVKYLLFTHVDHTGNHERWHEVTQAPRLIHKSAVVHRKNDYSPHPVTSMFELQLTSKPLEDSQPIQACPELRAVHTPGHSAGDLCFLYRDKFLFTGDVLAYSPARDHLVAHRIECWQDWAELTRSIKHLESKRFLWVLPGHGDRRRFSSEAETQAAIGHCVAWMEGQDGGYTGILRFVLWLTLRSKKNRLLYFLADNLVLPAGARSHLPNWTMPPFVWWGSLLVPFLGLWAAGWNPVAIRREN